MTNAQKLLRQALLDQQDAALECWPQGKDPSFRERVRAVAEKLEQLARETDATGGDALERARTWRFAGLAYQDVSVGMHDAELDEQLMPAVVAFQKADVLLRNINDPIEQMKLDFAYGRALFRLSHGRHVNIARQARDRSASALRLARLHSPTHVPSTEEALDVAEKGLALVEGGARIDEEIAGYGQSKQKSDILAAQTSLKSHAQEGPERPDANFEAFLSMLRTGLLKGAPNSDPSTSAEYDRLEQNVGELLKFTPTKKVLRSGDRVCLSMRAGTFKPSDTGYGLEIEAGPGRVGTILSGWDTPGAVTVQWDAQMWNTSPSMGEVELGSFAAIVHTDYLELLGPARAKR